MIQATCGRQMDSKQLALRCRELADNKKAENIVVLDVRELSSVTDYFVLATGGSEPQLRAIVEEIKDRLREEHEVRRGGVSVMVEASNRRRPMLPRPWAKRRCKPPDSYAGPVRTGRETPGTRSPDLHGSRS